MKSTNDIQLPHVIRFAVDGDLGAVREAIDQINKIDKACVARLEANEVMVDIADQAAYSKFYHWCLVRK